MKRLLPIIICCFFTSTAIAQQITAQIGRVQGGFDYKDSEGTDFPKVHSKGTASYSIGYRYRLSNIFYPVLQVNFNNYNTYSSDEKYGNSYAWDLNYLGVNLGMDAEVWTKQAFHIVVNGSFNPQFLTKGVQTLNGQTYDLKDVEQFNHPFLFLRGGAGLNYCIDDNIALSLKYQYGYGFSMGNDEDGESLRLTSQTISIGLLISLQRFSYCYKTNYK